MKALRFFVLGILLIIVMAACTAAADKDRHRVLCPACGTELDVFYEKHF